MEPLIVHPDMPRTSVHLVAVVVPHGRSVWMVEADGNQAVLDNTTTPPGCGYDIQVWAASLPEPPTTVTIKFNPAP
jgi:hypothetical protein